MPQATPPLRVGRDVVSSSCLAALSFLFVSISNTATVEATTFVWDGSASNDWATAANWSGNAVPSAGGNRISIGVSGTAVTFANRAIYSAAQGTQVFTGTGVSDSNRGLFIANGASGFLEINGGVFESQSSAPDGMGNAGGAGTLWINGGTYRKITGTGAASTFALLFTTGNSLLDIDAGAFEVTTLDFQNGGAAATNTGVVQLDGGLLSVANFARTSFNATAAYAMNLNGGTLQARADTTWSDLGNVTWAVQSNSVIDTQGFNVTLAEVLGGEGGLAKVGTGTLTLTGTNSFTGGLVIKEGTVTGTSTASALGGSGTGSVTLGDSSGSADATLLGDSRTFANPIIVAGGTTGTLTIGNTAGAAATFSGNVTLDNDLTLAVSGGSVALSGSITGDGNLTINGTGLAQLSGSNTGFTGDVTVESGILRLGLPAMTTSLSVENAVTVNSGATFRLIGVNTTIGALSGGGTVESFAISTLCTLTFGGDNTSTTFSGLIQDGNTADFSIHKVGTGTFTMAGSSTISESFTISEGTVKLDFGAADSSKLSDTGSLVLASGTLELSGGSHVDVTGSTSLTAGTASTITRTSGSAVVELNSITVNSGASVNFVGSGIATTNNRNSNGILGAWATVTEGDATSWAANVTDSDDGSIVAYTGYTDIPRLGPSVVPNDGTQNVRIVNGGASGAISLGASPVTDINTLQIDASAGPALIDPAGATDILRLGELGGILQTKNAGGLTIGAAANDGVLTVGGADTGTAASLTLINESAVNDLTIHSAIADNGTESVSLLKSGAGRVVVAGSSAFTGSVRINEGTLFVGSVTGANTTATLGALTGVTNNGSLIFRRTDTSFQDAAGAISGSGTVTYLGSGVVNESQYSVNNGSTYTGGTLIDDARVSVTSNTGFGTGTVTVADGGQLYVSTSTLANNVTISGNGWAETAGSLGAIRFNASNGNITGAITLAANSRITASTNISGTVTGAIGGGFNLEVGAVGASGTVVLSGDNSYTGLTTVNAGVLRVSNDSALGSTGAGTVVKNGARVDLANGITIDDESITISGSGGNNFGALQAMAGATGTWSGSIVQSETASRIGAASGGHLIVNGDIDAGGFATFVVRSENAATSIVTLGGTLGNLGSGGTFAIFNGVVRLGAAERIQNNAIVQLGTNQNVSLVGTLDLNGHHETIQRLHVDTAVTASQVVTNSSATAATLTLSSNTNTAYNHLFTGNLGLSKQGANTLTLGGANTHTGDTLVVTGTLALGNVNALQNSTLDTGTAGTQAVTFTLAGANTYNLGGLKGADHLSIGGNTISVGANNQSTSYTGNISGTGGGFTKVGTGAITLAGDNAYTGATTVDAGTLQVGVNGAGSIGGSAVAVNGAALAGSGAINSSVTIGSGGALRPGDSAGAGRGTLTIDGAANDLTMAAAGAEFEFRAGANGISFANQASGIHDVNGNLNAAYTVAANRVADANDRVVVGDQINLISGGVIDFDFDGYTANAGDAFDLLDWTAAILNLNGFTYGSATGDGRFRTGGAAENLLYDLDLPTLNAGQFWDMSLFESHGIIVVVPEPSRVLLLGIAFMAMILRRRR